MHAVELPSGWGTHENNENIYRKDKEKPGNLTEVEMLDQDYSISSRNVELYSVQYLRYRQMVSD